MRFTSKCALLGRSDIFIDRLLEDLDLSSTEHTHSCKPDLISGRLSLSFAFRKTLVGSEIKSWKWGKSSLMRQLWVKKVLSIRDQIHLFLWRISCVGSTELGQKNLFYNIWNSNKNSCKTKDFAIGDIFDLQTSSNRNKSLLSYWCLWSNCLNLYDLSSWEVEFSRSMLNSQW